MDEQSKKASNLAVRAIMMWLDGGVRGFDDLVEDLKENDPDSLGLMTYGLVMLGSTLTQQLAGDGDVAEILAKALDASDGDT